MRMYVPILILPVNTSDDKVFKVRTLLDSGSEASCIEGQFRFIFLSKEKQVKVGYKKLKVITLASEVIKKFRIVIVYFRSSLPQQ